MLINYRFQDRIHKIEFINDDLTIFFKTCSQNNILEISPLLEEIMVKLLLNLKR